MIASFCCKVSYNFFLSLQTPEIKLCFKIDSIVEMFFNFSLDFFPPISFRFKTFSNFFLSVRIEGVSEKKVRLLHFAQPYASLASCSASVRMVCNSISFSRSFARHIQWGRCKKPNMQVNTVRIGMNVKSVANVLKPMNIYISTGETSTFHFAMDLYSSAQWQ